MMSKVKLQAEKGFRCELDIEIRAKKPSAAHLGDQLFDHGLTIDLQPAPESVQELSICAIIWRNGWESEAGQCRQSVREMVPYLTKTKGDALRELCLLWQRWHLNAMISGSRAQREALTEAAESDRHIWEYLRATEHLTVRGLNPDHGYAYGQGWLVEPLPDDVVKKVGRLCVELGGKIIDL